MVRSLILFCLSFLISLSSEVQNSVVMEITELESGKNLNPKKYLSSQYQEIQKGLAEQDQKLRIVTYNMLFDLYDAKLAEENRWKNRYRRIVELVENMQPDIICTQELRPHQVEDLMKELGKTYGLYANKEKTGGLEGILYRKKRLSLLEGKEWNIPHKGYDTALVMAYFTDLKTEKKLYVFNTHLPFSVASQREKSAIQISKIIKGYLAKGPVVFAGDMNTFPNRPDLRGLPFYDGECIEALISKFSGLKDAMNASLLGHVGPIGSFTNKPDSAGPFKGTGTPGVILDHIYVSKQIEVLIHAIEPAQVDGHFPSDHMPVLIDAVLYY